MQEDKSFPKKVERLKQLALRPNLSRKHLVEHKAEPNFVEQGGHLQNVWALVHDFQKEQSRANKTGRKESPFYLNPSVVDFVANAYYEAIEQSLEAVQKEAAHFRKENYLLFYGLAATILTAVSGAVITTLAKKIHQTPMHMTEIIELGIPIVICACIFSSSAIVSVSLTRALAHSWASEKLTILRLKKVSRNQTYPSQFGTRAHYQAKGHPKIYRQARINLGLK